MGIDNLKSLLKKYNLRPNFTYGQNFLVDEIILEDIVDAADVSSGNWILEIGPGLGNLTRRLCERGAKVLSVEKDPHFLPLLKAIKKDYPENFKFEIADALEFNYTQAFNDWQLAFSRKDSANSSPLNAISYKVVANIPYYITGKILEMFMTAKFKPEAVVVLAQKEVAERACALVGELNLLGISVQLYGDPKIVRLVPARAFYPEPKVQSAILKIVLHKKPKYEIKDEKKFFTLLRACFAGKRKQLHNTLVNNLKLKKEEVFSVLESLDLDPKTRPQQLSIDEWIMLAKKIFI